MKQGMRAEKFISPHWWTSVIWRMQNWRQSTKNTKVELYSEVILKKMILVRTQCSLNKDHQHLKWQPKKSWTLYQENQDAQDKQLMQYPLTPGPNGRWPNVIKNSKVRMSRCLDTSTEAQRAKIMVQYGRPPVVPLERNLYGHPLAGLWLERQFEKFYWNTVGKKFFLLGMFICQLSKRTIPISVCGRYQTTQKTENVEPTEKIMEDVD